MKITLKIVDEFAFTSVFQSNSFRVKLYVDRVILTIYWIVGGKLMKYPYASRRISKWIC